MKKQRLKYLKDEFGKEILLKDDSLQVMMEWEKPYMEACIDALQPSGDVLEIGFGLGYSSTHIQKYSPKSHTIIECDPTVIQKAEDWSKSYSHIKIIQGTWQDCLKDLGQYDAIFFDDYAPFSAEEEEKIENEIKKLQTVKNKIKNLYEQLKQKLESLMNFGNNQKAEVERVIPNNDFLPSNRLFQFFQLCLDHHMREGALLSSYIDFAQFKKQHSVFQKLIVSRPDVIVIKQIIPVEVPPNCQYYAGNEALILIIRKIKI